LFTSTTRSTFAAMTCACQALMAEPSSVSATSVPKPKTAAAELEPGAGLTEARCDVCPERLGLAAATFHRAQDGRTAPPRRVNTAGTSARGCG
jgi:hypothetical protein